MSLRCSQATAAVALGLLLWLIMDRLRYPTYEFSNVAHYVTPKLQSQVRRKAMAKFGLHVADKVSVPVGKGCVLAGN